MNLPVNNIRVEELSGIIDRIKRNSFRSNMRITDISVAKSENGEPLPQNESPKFNLKVEIDDTALSPEQLTQAQKSVESCLIRNQDWM
jgi:hypothetical protein